MSESYDYPSGNKIKEAPKTQFEAGDYIVIDKQNVITNDFSLKQFPPYFCFKQRINSDILAPQIDGNGSTNNGWNIYRYNNTSNWRYATEQERAQYEILGKPYNTKMKASENLQSDYYKYIGLKETKRSLWSSEYTIGKIYKNNIDSGQYSYYLTSNSGTKFFCDRDQFVPATKQEFDDQHKPIPRSTFNVGDRVRLKEDESTSNKLLKGMEALVIKGGSHAIGVSFDDFTNGHALGGDLPQGSNSGWNINSSSVELISTEEFYQKIGHVKVLPVHNFKIGDRLEPKSAYVKSYNNSGYEIEKRSARGVDFMVNKISAESPKLIGFKDINHLYDCDEFILKGTNKPEISGYATWEKAQMKNLNQHSDLFTQPAKPSESIAPKWNPGGYIKLTKEYNSLPIGSQGKITVYYSEGMVTARFENDKICNLFTGENGRTQECEWIGMDKPTWKENFNLSVPLGIRDPNKNILINNGTFGSHPQPYQDNSSYTWQINGSSKEGMKMMSLHLQEEQIVNRPFNQELVIKTKNKQVKTKLKLEL
jgi:hypothetical protein